MAAASSACASRSGERRGARAMSALAWIHSLAMAVAASTAVASAAVRRAYGRQGARVVSATVRSCSSAIAVAASSTAVSAAVRRTSGRHGGRGRPALRRGPTDQQRCARLSTSVPAGQAGGLTLVKGSSLCELYPSTFAGVDRRLTGALTFLSSKSRCPT